MATTILSGAICRIKNGRVVESYATALVAIAVIFIRHVVSQNPGATGGRIKKTTIWPAHASFRRYRQTFCVTSGVARSAIRRSIASITLVAIRGFS